MIQRLLRPSATILSIGFTVGAATVPAASPSSEKAPIRIVEPAIDLALHDGGLRPAIGVENIQVLRANRTAPGTADGYGWTYNHAPMLAYWNGKFYLEYLSNPIAEHHAPGQTLVVTSDDGRNWRKPEVVFPIYHIRPGTITSIESGMAMMHQRMGFYVAPNGRLLVLGFYGRAPFYKGENGIGRVVREAYKDGSYGPIHFLRFNENSSWNESNTAYPFYTRSSDAGFVEACEALLADKLKTIQWWDEEQNRNGFFSVMGPSSPSIFHRKDGVAVAVWKHAYTALSSDEGRSWTEPVKAPGMTTSGAKAWAQRTRDGRFSLVYNPVEYNSHRWPLVVVSSDDGVVFDDMLLINGEVPPLRYAGRAKDFGQQYMRGIAEGNGTPPSSDLWVTYSMNKEDIWISRVPVPLRDRVVGPVRDGFDEIAAGGPVPDWNLYRPRWADVSVHDFPSSTNKSLRLVDSDPYDYAGATRVFTESKSARIRLRLHPHQSTHGKLELEVADARSRRPVRIVFDQHGRIQAFDGSRMTEVASYTGNAWHMIEIVIRADAQTYDLVLDGRLLVANGAFAEPVESVERLVLRTGDFRTTPDRETDRYGPWDLSAPGDPVPMASYSIDDVVIE